MIVTTMSQLQASLADHVYSIVPFVLERPYLRYILSFFFNEDESMGRAIENLTRKCNFTQKTSFNATYHYINMKML